MAYVTTNPPKLLQASIAHGGPAIWTYSSTDAASVVVASGYITNGGDLGMKVNDLVLITDTDAVPPVLSSANVVTVSSTAPGAVDLSDAITLGGGGNAG